MASDTPSTVGERTVTAFFDTAGSARTAVDDLVAAGVERDHISQTGGQDAAAQAAVEKPHLGFWESLKDFFLPEADRDVYAEGLRRGGFLLQVRTDRDNYDRVLDILDTDGAINMDERESGWRSEGWTGSTDQGSALGQTGTVAMATGPSGGVIPGAGLTSMAGDTTPRTLENAREAGRPGVAEPTHVRDTFDAEEVVRRTDEATFGADAAGSRGRDAADADAQHVRDSLSAGEAVRRTEDAVPAGGIAGGAPSSEPPHVCDTFDAEEAVRRTEDATLGNTGGSATTRAGDADSGDPMARGAALDTFAAAEAGSPSYRRDTSHGRARLRGYVLEGGQEAGEAAAGSFSPDRDRDRIVEHMQVFSADGQQIGTVDHLDGPDRIKLTRSGSPDGQHHHVPFTWIDHVDQHVHLRKTLAEIKAQA